MKYTAHSCFVSASKHTLTFLQWVLVVLTICGGVQVSFNKYEKSDRNHTHDKNNWHNP